MKTDLIVRKPIKNKEYYTEDDVISDLKLALHSNKSMRSWAKDNGLTPSMIPPIIRKTKPMQPKVAKFLGYKPIRVWVKL